MLCLGLAFVLGSCASAGEQDATRSAYPGSYTELRSGAAREGVVRIDSTTEDRRVRDLIDGFKRRYPGVKVVYTNMSGSNVSSGFLADLAAGRPPADLLWSSAMDLQIKLVNDGYAQSYASPERAHIPDWANWKQQAWGITAEPIVILYNRRLIDRDAIPDSHLSFQRLLEDAPDGAEPRVATYDPTRSAVGYLFLAQDAAARHDAWRTVRALGKARARLFETSDEIIDDVRAGRSVIGYNAMGSYVADEMSHNADIAVVVPRDYALVMSRIAIIPAKAPHPNAARMFLDYMLSREGQTALARHSMPSVRRDVPYPAALAARGVPMRAIRVGPALLVQQDAMTRRYFQRRWEQAITVASGGPEKLRP